MCVCVSIYIHIHVYEQCVWRGVELKRPREADGISCYRGMLGESDGTCESPSRRAQRLRP